ncbi:hypothetical protein HYU11_05355 [Candidatus Woesearchaeota archaeon]|nr:hypothetical protein [Candidatus Woesearchaeota archaeon]
MKMRLLLVFAAIVMITGCSKIPGGKSGGEIPFSYDAIHTGSEGVKLEFISNAPPNELLAPSKDGNGYPFRLGVKATNKGATKVENGYITVTAEDDYLDLDNGFTKTYTIDGKNFFNPQGESEAIIFNGITKKFKEGQSDKYRTTVLATTCYKYLTEVKKEICIDTDILDLKKKQKICTTKDISLSNQGGPVAVTKIETKLFPEGGSEGIAYVKPQFVITIRNVGDGQIVNPDLDMASVCSSELIADKNQDMFKKAWNIVKIRARLSDKELACFPNPLKIREGDDIMRCSMREDEKIDANLPTYNSPLVVSIEYGYTSTISKEVMVTKDLDY